MKKFILVLIMVLLSGCVYPPPTQLPTRIAVTPNTTDIKSTNPDTAETDETEVITGTVGLSGWVRYPVIPSNQNQQVGGDVSINDYEFPGAHLIVCVDSDCVPVLSDLEGKLSVTFSPPNGEWLIGDHTFKIEYVGRTPSLELIGSFTAITGTE